jgi:DNA-binding transcriptional MocR family regulator
VSRVPLNDWLRAVESRTGPMPPELRHLCYVLARFMSGDGHAGCFPGSRSLAERMGVHRATVSRRLLRLRELGWLDVELRKRQFGRVGSQYFPSVPMAQVGAPIHEPNGALGRANGAREPQIGAPERANDGAQSTRTNGAGGAEIGAADREIGAPSVRLTLLQTPTEKSESAASPSPAQAGAAAGEPEQMSDDDLREVVHTMRLMKWPDEKILEKHAKYGMTRRHLT